MTNSVNFSCYGNDCGIMSPQVDILTILFQLLIPKLHSLNLETLELHIAVCYCMTPCFKKTAIVQALLTLRYVNVDKQMNRLNIFCCTVGSMLNPGKLWWILFVILFQLQSLNKVWKLLNTFCWHLIVMISAKETTCLLRKHCSNLFPAVIGTYNKLRNLPCD